jgi:hypothetical protein
MFCPFLEDQNYTFNPSSFSGSGHLGSIRAFLKDYLVECITPGYPAGPLEQEAITKAAKIVGRCDS